MIHGADMNIQIMDGLLSFETVCVRYDRQLSSVQVKEMLREWLPRLKGVSAEKTAIYLPYSIDEEYIEAFEAVQNGEEIALTAVKLDGLGYTTGIDSLVEAIGGKSPVVPRRRKALLV